MQGVTFTLQGLSGITLDDFANQDFGIRIMSIGTVDTDGNFIGSRDGSAKIVGEFGDLVTNHAPDAVDDKASVTEDTAPNPVGGNVLGNDTDVDVGDTHSVTAVNGVAVDVGKDVVGTYGTLHLNSDGSYTYKLDDSKVQFLAEGTTKTDVFSYTNSDNHGGSDTANLTITITGTNDAPDAVDDKTSVTEDDRPEPGRRQRAEQRHRRGRWRHPQRDGGQRRGGGCRQGRGRDLRHAASDLGRQLHLRAGRQQGAVPGGRRHQDGRVQLHQLGQPWRLGHGQLDHQHHRDQRRAGCGGGRQRWQTR